MSSDMAAVRELIADALTGVPGVTAPSPTPPATPTAGAAWPVWTRVEWVNDCTRDTTWMVYVVLGSGTLAARTLTADDLAQPLGEALYALGELGEIEPVSLTAADPTGQPMPALRATLIIRTSGG